MTLDANESFSALFLLAFEFRWERESARALSTFFSSFSFIFVIWKVCPTTSCFVILLCRPRNINSECWTFFVVFFHFVFVIVESFLRLNVSFKLIYYWIYWLICFAYAINEWKLYAHTVDHYENKITIDWSLKSTIWANRQIEIQHWLWQHADCSLIIQIPLNSDKMCYLYVWANVKLFNILCLRVLREREREQISLLYYSHHTVHSIIRDKIVDINPNNSTNDVRCFLYVPLHPLAQFTCESCD